MSKNVLACARAAVERFVAPLDAPPHKRGVAQGGRVVDHRRDDDLVVELQVEA